MSTPTTVLITGANTGIGYEIVRALCRSESTTAYRIILCGRSSDKAEAAAAAVRAEYPATRATISTQQLDLASDASISAAAGSVEKTHGHIDVLVNNAGAAFDYAIADGSLTPRAAWNMAYDTNVTGTHLLTTALAPLLLASPAETKRLIFITSGTSSLAETIGESPVNKIPAAGWPKPGTRSILSYRVSKAGTNMLMRGWAQTLGADGVKVFALAPGFLATGLGNEKDVMLKLGAKEPWVGGESARRVIEGGRDADAGLVVRNYASPVQPW